MNISMIYQVFLDGELLPQTPSSVTVSNSSKNEVFTLADGRPFTVAKFDGPMSIEFEFTVTKKQYSVTFPEANRSLKHWVEKLAEIKQSRRAIEFLITRPGGDSDYYEVLLEDYSWKEDAEDASDATFSISLTEYCPQNNQELDTEVEHHLITAGNARGWINDVDKAALEEEARIAAEEAEEQAQKEAELAEKEAQAAERAAEKEAAEGQEGGA